MTRDYNQSFIIKWWRSIDQQIIIALLVLFSFSLILVTTSGSAIAIKLGLDEHYFSLRQMIYLALASFIILAISSCNTKWLKRIAILGFIMSTILLVLVKFFGYEVKGATRWISIFGLSMQPSEFIKPFFAVVVGWLLSLKFEDEFPSFSICAGLYVIISALLLLQPDFGMFLMISAVFGIQLFISGMPLFWILLTIIAGMFGIGSAYIFLPHVTKRINNFLDPESNENYQVSKSLAAFEHGGMYGIGPGEGLVKQVLPDSHTDFIFAVAGEEFGAIICFIVIGIFGFIVIRSLLKLINENDKLIQFASVGIIAQFGLQSIINIGVTLNLFPTKGMTLPFISYGGSSTLAIAISVGMLLGFTKRITSLIRYRIQEID